MNRRDALKNSALLSAYAFSAGTVAAILSGCNPDIGVAIWKPAFFSPDQNNMLITLVDAIMPKSDTPGASDVGVHKFIDKLMVDYCTDIEKEDFKLGLNKVIEAKPEDIIAHLTGMAKEAEQNDKVKSQGVDDYKSREFFTQLRSLTLLGYYGSEEIGTNVLAYDPIPGEYIGCYPLEKTEGRAWTI